MLRTSTSTWVAFAATLIFTTGFAQDAQAVSALRLLWAGSGTPVTGNVTTGAPPSITANVVLEGHTAPVIGVFVTFVFDYDEDVVNAPGVFTADTNELNATHALGLGKEHSSVKIAMGNTFAPLNSGLVLLQESTGAQVGQIGNFDQATLDTGCDTTCTVTLGTVLFTTGAEEGTAADDDVRAGVIVGGTDTISVDDPVAGPIDDVDALTFAPAQVLPEPAAGVVGAVALASILGLARRRR